MSTPNALREFSEASFASSRRLGGKPVSYRWMSPAAAPSVEARPLIVFLHGAGERGTDNRAQLKYLPELLARTDNRRRYECFVLAPQCPAEEKWIAVDWHASASTEIPVMAEPLEWVSELIDEVLRVHPIDRRRVYLTGISMGGFATWTLALQRPHDFAAVAPICGGGDPSRADRLRDVPLWAVHGRDDEVVSVEFSRRMVAAVQAADGRPRYSELPDVGHDSWTHAYEPAFGLLDWMFAQVRS